MAADFRTNIVRLDDLFFAVAKEHPERHCVTFDDYATASKCTYKEMTSAVERVKAALQKLAAEGETIGIAVEASLVFPAVILGVLAARMSFAYLNSERFVKKCGVRFCFKSEDSLLPFGTTVVQKLMLMNTELELVKLNECGEVADCHVEIAYVMHTSGTTGEPKVVRVPHSCIVPNVINLRKTFDVRQTDTVFMSSPPTFDPSVVDIFMALSTGAMLLLVPESRKCQPAVLCELLFCRNKTSVIQATPTLLCRFGNKLLKSTVLAAESPLRILALGGEKCQRVETLRSWKADGNHTRIFNLYGITEVSCWATVAEVNFSQACGDVPLGKPLKDTLVEVRKVTEWELKAEEGVMFVGSKTRKCQIDDEVLDNSSELKMRCTGDIVRAEGSDMYYVSRVDDIVKRHGKKVHLAMLEDEACRLLGDSVQCAACFCPETQRLGLFLVGKCQFERSKLHVPSALIPDYVMQIDSVPMTQHGKVDRKTLAKMMVNDLEKTYIPLSRDEIINIISEVWCNWINDTPRTDHNFCIHGGDSLKAVHFCSDVEQRLGFNLCQLLDKVLHCTYNIVCDYVCESALQLEVEAVAPKRLKLSEKRVQVSGSTGQISWVCRGRTSGQVPATTGVWTLQLLWSYDTGKCVDSSPLVIKMNDGTSRVVVGSHSHKVFCIDVDSGKEVWCMELGDRVESSPCGSPCGAFIYIGCYDHCLYCLSLNSGEIKWLFRTEGEVKSTPSSAFLSVQTIVVFGSHDHHLYCVDGENGCLIWRRKVGNGSVFSSPLIDGDSVFACTLDGICGAFDIQSGDMKWTARIGKPIFSSPSSCEAGVLFGCVDGNLYCYSRTGEKLWQFDVSAPIFSSPCITNHGILIGSHKPGLHCLDQSGHCLWEVKMSAAVYGVPFAFSASSKLHVASCTSNGYLQIHSLKDVELEAQYKFPGEVFSSPVVFGDKLIVGCRDNNLYCMSWTNKPESK